MRKNTSEPIAPETTKDQKSSIDEAIESGRIRLSQNFVDLVGVKKALLTIPVRKPGKQDFIRTHPDPAYWLETAVLELKDDRETYLVEPDLWSQLPGEIVPMVLITAINRQGVLFLWPIRLPMEDGRHNEWHRSALEAAKLAQTKWVRVVANMSLHGYDVFEATGSIPEPKWPDKGFEEILKTAFKDKFISDLNHPVMCRLQGAS